MSANLTFKTPTLGVDTFSELVFFLNYKILFSLTCNKCVNKFKIFSCVDTPVQRNWNLPPYLQPDVVTNGNTALIFQTTMIPDTSKKANFETTKSLGLENLIL